MADAQEDDEGTITLARAQLEHCPNISLDYAIMEKTQMAAVVAPVDIGWDDVGSWDALGRHSRLADDANTAEVDGKNNFLISSGKMIAVIGVDDLVVVETPDAILVVPKDRSQDVSKLVKHFQQTGKTDLL